MTARQTTRLGANPMNRSEDALFEDNDAGLIDNPLLHWNPSQVERNARNFAQSYGLHNQQRILVKGAKILYDPEAWESVPDLTADEIDALRRERKVGFWGQSKQLRITIITLCVAAVVQGWNQTASNGANLDWPQQLGLQVTGCDPQGRDAWIFAAVNASPYLSAGLLGCWLSDPLNEYLFGRRAAIAFSAALIIAAAVGGALTQTWQQLLGCRIILGVGMGAKASVVPVFAAEVAPAHIRGSLVMNWQLFDAFGIFLGFSANLIALKVGAAAWRWQTASSVLPAIVLLSLIWVVPESPRFLMKHGRYREAYHVLAALRGEAILAAKEILYIHYQMVVEAQAFSQTKVPDAEVGQRRGSASTHLRDRFSLTRRSSSIGYWTKMRQLFTVKRIRRAMVAAAVTMLAQQLTGVNVLQFFSSTIFCVASSPPQPQASSDVSHERLAPLLLSWGIGLSNFVFAFPAYWLIDRCGRRWLMLLTLPFLAVTLLATGLAFLIPWHSGAHTPVIVLFTYIFMFFYSWGPGPVPFTLSAEVFPLENRVVGMSLAVFVNLFGAGILTLFVPVLTDKVGHPGLLGLFAGLNVLAFGLVFFFVRETAGAALGGTPGSLTFMSLEELNYIFGVPTRKHARYQLRTVLPWAWRYYVRRDRTAPAPDKLYTWARAGEGQEKDEAESPDPRGVMET